MNYYVHYVMKTSILHFIYKKMKLYQFLNISYFNQPFYIIYDN